MKKGREKESGGEGGCKIIFLIDRENSYSIEKHILID
jgi:hypothetical protein